MIPAIAIDDEPVALDIIRMHAAQVPFVDLKETFTSARAALRYLATEQIELIFLDITMPDIGGLEFATMISPDIQIIFTTAHSDYAVAGFDLAITDFLLKPINLDRFLKSCNQAAGKARTRAQPDNRSESKSLFVKDGYNWVKINLDHLLYIKAEDNYLSLVEQDRQILTRMTVQEFMKLSYRNFIRVHKSYIVNATRIQKVERHQVLIDGINIPISKTFSEDLRRHLFSYSLI
jgi:two-component system, LytTR family, response regulator